MARRPKQQSLIEIALTGDWKVSATFAVVLSAFTFVVIPLIANSVFRAFALALKPLGLVLAAIFGLISLVKYLRQNTSNYQYSSIHHVQHVEKSKHADVFNIYAAPKEMSDAERRFFLLGSPPGSRFERPMEWSLKLIKDIEWKKFEELSTAYYLEKGIRAEATSLGADGGNNIKLGAVVDKLR